jgi:hypothetical protein
LSRCISTSLSDAELLLLLLLSESAAALRAALLLRLLAGCLCKLLSGLCPDAAAAACSNETGLMQFTGETFADSRGCDASAGGVFAVALLTACFAGTAAGASACCARSASLSLPITFII